jgi:hypothetical protein
MIPCMLHLSVVLLAGALTASTPATAAPAPHDLFRLELQGDKIVWSQDKPMQSGGLILFHRYPDGMLLSIRRADVRRIVVTKGETSSNRVLTPGGVVDLGPTGSGAQSAPAAAGKAPAKAGQRPLGLGERKDGTALFNPDRPYVPDWDSKQVPGLNVPLPASPNDYREGKTVAYPPGSATQSAPGEPPMMKPSSGEPPRGPQ